MKILHAAETCQGGIATYFNETLSFQVEKFGSQNIKLIVPADHSKFIDEALSDNLNIFFRNSRGILGIINLIKCFSGSLKQFKPEVVFLHSSIAGAVCRFYILLFRCFGAYRKIKVIYCAHGIVNQISFPRLYKIFLFIEKILGNSITNKVIALSIFEKNMFIAAGVDENKVEVIYNGIAPHKYDEITPNYDSKKEIRFLFIGRFDHQKGIDLLIDAIAQVDSQNYHLTLVGDAVNDKDFDTTQLSKNSRLTLTGWLSPEEVRRQIQKTDVLIIPSRCEGCSLVPIEAMHYGVPIISSDAFSLPEQIDDGVTGLLFSSGDSEILAEKILQIINEPEILESMSKQAYQRYLDFFTSEKMNNSISSVLEE